MDDENYSPEYGMDLTSQGAGTYWWDWWSFLGDDRERGWKLKWKLVFDARLLKLNASIFSAVKNHWSPFSILSGHSSCDWIHFQVFIEFASRIILNLSHLCSWFSIVFILSHFDISFFYKVPASRMFRGRQGTAKNFFQGGRLVGRCHLLPMSLREKGERSFNVWEHVNDNYLLLVKTRKT